MKLLLAMVALLCALALGLVLNLASGVFVPLVIAWFLLKAFRPVIDLGSKIRLPQTLNVILVFSVFFGLCVIGVNFCTTQVVAFSRVFETYSSKLNDMIENIIEILQIPPESVPSISWFNVLGQYARNISEVALTLSAKFILTLVFFMFMLLEAPYLNDKLDQAFSGKSAMRIKKIMTSVNDDISHYLGTLALISMMTGVFVWFALLLLEVELAAGWAVLTFVLNFIPTVGSIIATIPPVLVAMLQFSPSWFRPLVVLICLGAIQLTIGNVVTPKVVGDRLGLSPVFILLSLLLWGAIWGIPGAILSVPIASIIKIVCENVSSLKPIAVMMGNGQPAFPEKSGRNEKEKEEEEEK
jgi:predicted PurR-regulated permease PerM